LAEFLKHKRALVASLTKARFFAGRKLAVGG
jgi:hypothetical protein